MIVPSGSWPCHSSGLPRHRQHQEPSQTTPGAAALSCREEGRAPNVWGKMALFFPSEGAQGVYSVHHTWAQNNHHQITCLLKEELPSTAPTASTASQDNGEGKTSSPSARLCSCQGTIASPKKGPQRARPFTSAIGRAGCTYDSVHSGLPWVPGGLLHFLHYFAKQ